MSKWGFLTFPTPSWVTGAGGGGERDKKIQKNNRKLVEKLQEQENEREKKN